MDGYDAFLLVSFGGPERPEDVMSFLQNVTAGRNIPRERLEQVAEHYYHFGGVSPINQQCRELLTAIEKDFAVRGVGLPVYWGNRNWDPYLTDTLAEMASAGVRRALAFVTSAFSSFSSCRQYLGDIEHARQTAGPRSPEVSKIRQYFNHPGYIAAFADTAAAAAATLPAGTDYDLIFTAHSVPQWMADAAGPAGGAYQAQLAEAARLVAAEIGYDRRWQLAYTSRSGPPSQPWLEPDVNDLLRELAGAGTRAVVVVPIGFISDHMEVKFDLDVEAAQTARETGITLARAATPGTHPRFVSMVTDLVCERLDGSTPLTLGALPAGPDSCPAGCCGRPPGASGRRRRARDGPVTVPSESAEPAALLALAADVAAEAADLLLARHGRVSVVQTKSSPTDVVTEMDQAAERLIRDRLLAARPGDAVLGEEGGESGEGPVRWVVDPLDGTVNYLYGLPNWAVSIAAEVDGQIVAGVVCAPVLRSTFTATLGGGAWLESGWRPGRERLACTDGVRMSNALVATGFGYPVAQRTGQGAIVAGVLPVVRDIRRAGAAAVDLCSVASGQVDAYYEQGTHYWDIAAGGLIAREAGATTGGLHGAPAGRALTLAASPGLFAELHDLLAGLGADQVL